MQLLFNRSPRFYRNWFWFSLFLILTVSSIPRLPDPTLRLNSISFEFRTDYFLHLLQYAVLISLFIFWRSRKNQQITKGIIVFALIMGILLGIADETHQMLIPRRRFNPVDMIYNCLGVLSGVVFSYWYLNRAQKRTIKDTITNAWHRIQIIMLS